MMLKVSAVCVGECVRWWVGVCVCLHCFAQNIVFCSATFVAVAVHFTFNSFNWLCVLALLQGKTTPSFEEVWPAMRPIVLKVLKQEPVTQAEWQDLFYGVHLICLWDEKGAAKIYECLQEDIVAFINVSCLRS